MTRGSPRIRILGTRGIPATHGGFETFAQNLSLHLVSRGWSVSVYCQEEGSGGAWESEWRGIRLIHVPVSQRGSVGTVVFDWKSTLHAAAEDGLVLVLGYNTAVMSLVYRRLGIPTVLNLDGVEWKRGKYNWLEKMWFRLNEFAAFHLSDHLVADHPEIAARVTGHVGREKVSMIPYGARAIRHADSAPLDALGLRPGGYALLVARPEPENSLLEVVRAFSADRRPIRLVVLGRYEESNRYHRSVREAAGDQVDFPGAIYQREVIDALRAHACFYVHGHTVGGTNPALVEALGSGMAILARDNPFNRWVAGDAAVYFESELACRNAIARLLSPGGEDELARLRAAARSRHDERFSLSSSLADYEEMLLTCSSSSLRKRARSPSLPMRYADMPEARSVLSPEHRLPGVGADD